VEPERATVAPHATLNLIVGLDLTHNRLRHLGQRVRPYVAHVTASWGDTNDQRVELPVEGRVKAVLDTWPPNLHLKDWLVEGEPGAEESVTLQPLIPLGTFYVKNTPAFLDVKIERQEKQYIAKVTPKANAPKGRFNTTIDFAITDKDLKPLPDHQLPVTGQVSGRYVWLPHESILGFQRVGESRDMTLRIEARRSNTFTVVDLIADKETSVNSLGDNVYRVSQKIHGLGEQQTVLKAVIRDADGKLHEIVHPIRWYASNIK
jgi:hypothetical protein